MKYTVLGAYSLGELITLVNEFLSKGWKTTGGICVTSAVYYQAMTSQEEA